MYLWASYRCGNNWSYCFGFTGSKSQDRLLPRSLRAPFSSGLTVLSSQTQTFKTICCSGACARKCIHGPAIAAATFGLTVLGSWNQNLKTICCRGICARRCQMVFLFLAHIHKTLRPSVVVEPARAIVFIGQPWPRQHLVLLLWAYGSKNLETICCRGLTTFLVTESVTRSSQDISGAVSYGILKMRCFSRPPRLPRLQPFASTYPRNPIKS